MKEKYKLNTCFYFKGICNKIEAMSLDIKGNYIYRCQCVDPDTNDIFWITYNESMLDKIMEGRYAKK